MYDTRAQHYTCQVISFVLSSSCPNFKQAWIHMKETLGTTHFYFTPFYIHIETFSTGATTGEIKVISLESCLCRSKPIKYHANIHAQCHMTHHCNPKKLSQLASKTNSTKTKQTSNPTHQYEGLSKKRFLSKHSYDLKHSLVSLFSCTNYPLNES